MRKLLFFGFFFCFSVVFANQCSTTLVSVMETDDGFEGVLANLTVLVSEGNGNVWVDTMPLTKVETQVSARLAREVACELLGFDCSSLDFYFVIRSEYVMVGGPSAGAPMTVCAMASLLNQSLRPDVSMTGTINPDGSVGPVAAIDDKADALSGFSYFLVPDGSGINSSVVNVVEVFDVLDAFRYYSGGYELILSNTSSQEIVNQDYISAMRLMAESLIDRAWLELNGSYASDLLNSSLSFYDSGEYYSSASYAVQSLIYSFYEQFSGVNASDLRVNVSNDLLLARDSFIDGLVIDHLYDLESFAVTMDRFRESEELVRQSLNVSSNDDAVFLLSFAKTRLITAIEWSSLLDYFVDNHSISFDVSSIKPLVIERLEAARNAIAYAQTVVSSYYLVSAQEHLNDASEAYVNDEFVFSLFESLKARAEANLIMELRGLNNLSSRIDFKQESAVRAISNSMNRGYLPFLSLSYLEYSDAFVEDEPYQALIFLAYSKEFASLGLSLNELVQYSQSTFDSSLFSISEPFDFTLFNFFLLMGVGFVLGLIFTLGKSF